MKTRKLITAVAQILWETVSDRNPNYSTGGGDYRRCGPLFVQTISSQKEDSSGRPAGEFIRRFGLKLGRFSVYLHRMTKSDPGRELHNHPWKAAFLVLKGGYEEVRAVSVPLGYPSHEGTLDTMGWPNVIRRRVLPGDVNLISQEVYHRVDKLLADEAWTLGVIWDRRASWGFWNSMNEHVDSREYHQEKLGG